MIFTKNNGDLNGLFNYFYKKKQNKIYDLFNVVSIGTYYPDGWSDAYTLINPSISGNTAKDNWCSPLIKNSFFQISFLKGSFVLSSYTLKSRTYSRDDMPRSWEVYGSLNGVNFTLIDQKTTSDLYELGASKNYEPDVKNFKLKYIKVVQVTNQISRDYFCMNKIELFGKLNQDIFTNKSSFPCSKSIVFVCLLMNLMSAV